MPRALRAKLEKSTVTIFGQDPNLLAHKDLMRICMLHHVMMLFGHWALLLLCKCKIFAGPGTKPIFSISLPSGPVKKKQTHLKQPISTESRVNFEIHNPQDVAFKIVNREWNVSHKWLGNSRAHVSPFENTYPAKHSKHLSYDSDVERPKNFEIETSPRPWKWNFGGGRGVRREISRNFSLRHVMFFFVVSGGWYLRSFPWTWGGSSCDSQKCCFRYLCRGRCEMPWNPTYPHWKFQTRL